jgi:hypothetical protein
MEWWKNGTMVMKRGIFVSTTGTLSIIEEL